jgi:hypothetical protein
MTYARIPAWEIVTGNHYTITEDDLVDGFNKLGIKVDLPLNTILCSGCDTPVPSSGVCESCCVVHADLAFPLTDIEHLGPGRIAA